LSNLAHIIGVAVSDTIIEMKMAIDRTTANSRNKRPTIPGISRIGMNTAISEILIESTVKPISCAPRSAAAIGFIPFILFIGFGLYHVRKVALASAQTGLANLGTGIEIAIWGFVACGLAGGYVLTWFPYILLGLAASARQIQLRGETP